MPNNIFGKCRSCPARVMWAKHKTTGRANPLDAEPSHEGNCLVTRGHESMVYEMLTGDDLTRARNESRPLHTSHFATCPNSKAHRKKQSTAYPEEVLAEADNRVEAEDLAHALRERFHRPITVPPGESPPFKVMLHEDLSQAARKAIQAFIDHYNMSKMQTALPI